MIYTVFLTNLDRLRHRTVTVPYPHRHRTVPPPYPTVPHRTPPYPPFFTLFGLKKLKNGGYGEVRWGSVGYGTVTVRVRYGDANGLNSLEIL